MDDEDDANGDDQPEEPDDGEHVGEIERDPVVLVADDDRIRDATVAASAEMRFASTPPAITPALTATARERRCASANAATTSKPDPTAHTAEREW